MCIYVHRDACIIFFIGTLVALYFLLMTFFADALFCYTIGLVLHSLLVTLF